MIILAMRTDKPEAEVGIFDGDKELTYDKWEAHRQLAESLHSRIEKNLKQTSKTWSDIEGVIVYQGPGSFTGLRIGISVANALASSLAVPIVGVTGNDWLKLDLNKLSSSENHEQVSPTYGAPAHITQPKK